MDSACRGWDEKQRIGYFMGRKPEMISEDLVDYMADGGFFSCPASSGHHGAFAGGNFWHSKTVAELLREYTDKVGYNGNALSHRKL